MTKELPYVANQLTPEGLDEVQQLVLGYHLKDNVAISGPPGVGKTVLVELLNQITGKNVVRLTCDEQMTESAVVGYPALEVNGASKTVWRNAAVTDAMEKGDIVYLDEADQLPKALQKRLDSVFDDAREIRRRDNTLIVANPDFAAFLSYNPTKNLAEDELAEAVADRFIHMEFQYLSPELEAALALADINLINTEKRAVYVGNDGVQFYRKEGDLWKPFWDGASVNGQGLPAGSTKYRVHNADGQWKGTGARADLAYKITRFFVPVRSFKDNGTNALDQAVKQQMQQLGTGEKTGVDLHPPSTRIVMKAIRQYDELVNNLGMPEKEAGYHAARLCVGQICRGRYGDEGLGQVTLRDAITHMASHYDLLPRPQQNTNLPGNP